MCVGVCLVKQDTLGATQRASAREQWAQVLERRPSDRAGVHGANQAPGTCSQATVLVVDTLGFSTHKDKEE